MSFICPSLYLHLFSWTEHAELKGEEKHTLKLNDQFKEMFDREWSRREETLLGTLQEMLKDSVIGEKHFNTSILQSVYKNMFCHVISVLRLVSRWSLQLFIVFTETRSIPDQDELECSRQKVLKWLDVSPPSGSALASEISTRMGISTAPKIF